MKGVLVVKPSGGAISAKILTDPKTVGKYVPPTVTLSVGQSITFANVSNFPHTVTATDTSFDSRDIPVKQTWTFTPKKPGTFKYYCVYHPLMKGVLVVKP